MPIHSIQLFIEETNVKLGSTQAHRICVKEHNHFYLFIYFFDCMYMYAFERKLFRGEWILMLLKMIQNAKIFSITFYIVFDVFSCVKNITNLYILFSIRSDINFTIFLLVRCAFSSKLWNSNTKYGTKTITSWKTKQKTEQNHRNQKMTEDILKINKANETCIGRSCFCSNDVEANFNQK